MEKLLTAALAYTTVEKLRGLLDSPLDLGRNLETLREIVMSLADRHTAQADALELPSLNPGRRHLLAACLAAMDNAVILRGLVLALADRVALLSEALTRQAECKVIVRPLPRRWTVTTLCGSTKFKKEFIEENFRLTRAGELVFSVGWFSHADGDVHTPTEVEKEHFDKVHFGKIDCSDGIHVINVGGYVGLSTRREIAYSLATGKDVRYREPVE
jgi:hypothetical protein